MIGIKKWLVVGSLALCFAESVLAEETTTKAAVPAFTDAAELFGLRINNLSQDDFERHLLKMGVQSFPTYKKGIASYSLGEQGILGIRELTVHYNEQRFIVKAVLSGVVESNPKRKSLGNLLVKKYGPPDFGFVNDGFGRGEWNFSDGTRIQLHNTTFDVSVEYQDLAPKVPSLSGRIDVNSLKKPNNPPSQ